MKRIAMAAAVAVALAAVAVARPGPDDTPEAIAARMATHQETAGLREISKPIVRANGATCTAGGSLGRIQALFLDLAASEHNLEVTAVEISRAPDTLLAKGVSSTVEYTVVVVAAPDERTAKALWTVPVLLNSLLSASVAAKSLTVISAKIGAGVMTVDARSQNGDASKSIATLLDPGPGHLVASVDVDQKSVREIVRDPSSDVPQRAVNFYAFKLVAKYDASSVRLDVLKRAAYN